MYESSKHANWLLVTLLVTLLISSLVLSWLLTRSSLFAGSKLVENAPATPQQLATNQDLLIPQPNPVQPPKANPAQDSTTASQQTALVETEKIPPVRTETSQIMALSLLDSQQHLEQAAVIPQAILPLASLAANTPNPLPKTTAPAALTLQGFIQPAEKEAQTRKKINLGWIYAGQFQNGAWSIIGLDLDATTLPEANQSYQLTWGANVRSAPPGQRMSTGSTNLAENVGYLAEGSRIHVVNVKQSGKNGHIWLEIQYGEEE